MNFIFFNVLLLIVWFKTDAFLEYAKLLGLSKWFKIDLFELERANDFELTYHSYLRKKYKERKYTGFLIRLVTCPICVMVWLCLPVIYVSGFGIYCINVVAILYIYYLFSKVMK